MSISWFGSEWKEQWQATGSRAIRCRHTGTRLDLLYHECRRSMDIGAECYITSDLKTPTNIIALDVRSFNEEDEGCVTAITEHLNIYVQCIRNLQATSL